jgi:hypothetical protein
MRIAKSLAAVAAGSMLVAGLAVATAGSASAADNGPLLAGNIYLFKVNAAGAKVSLATATGAEIVTSGTGLTRPFASSAVDASCPANTANSQMRIRIPQVGVDPLNWNEVPINAQSGAKVDANGHPYNDSRVDLLTNPTILDYVVANGGVNVPLPLTFTCFSAPGAALGYFGTTITMTAPDNLTLTSWSVPAPPTMGTVAAVSTTTTLAAAAAGANLTLTATVAPGSAVGSVTFKEGTTALGSAAVSGVATYTVTAPTLGAHTYSASFVPTDVTKFLASDAPAQSWTVAAGQGGIAVTLTVPAVVQTEPGSLTLSVPSSAAVTLSGARDSGNTRVTATATLPAIKVDDTRRSDLLTGWQVNVQASDFAGAQPISAKYLGWTPAATVTTTVNGSGSLLTTQAGPAVSSFLDAATSAGLSASATLGATTHSGQGSTTLGATLNLAIPSSTPQGSYSSTITVTLIAS